MAKETNEGWGFPSAGRKWHYFVNTMSLCRRWMFTGETALNVPSLGDQDCVVCTRKLAQRKE